MNFNYIPTKTYVLAGSVLLLISAISGIAVAQEDTSNTQHVRIHSELGDSWFDVWVYPENSTVRVKGTNPGARYEIVPLVIRVDGALVSRSRYNASSDETWVKSINFSNSIDVFAENHEIVVSTSGNHETFLVERDIDASRTTSVPAPRITDVEVGRVVHRGKAVAAVNVTVHNPSIHRYLARLMVHTTRTDGAIEPRGFQNESTTTVTIPLEQPPGDVAGEIRLYGGRADDQEDALAQVEFAGDSDGPTSFRNETYLPVPEPRAGGSNSEYHYRKSSSDDRSRSNRIQTTQRAVIASGLVTVVVAALWWRRG